MSEYLAGSHNAGTELRAVMEEVEQIIDAGGEARIKVTTASGTGKWGMAKLWYKWMSETAAWMAANGSKMPLMIKADGSWYGSRPFNEKDADELFTAQWLGVNEKGERLSWQKKEGANTADKGQRYIAMLKHENWCIEKGIKLTIKRDDEYSELKAKQDG